jgi:succinate-acetate transporter protein
MSEGKGYGNPAPAGLAALAVACFCFYFLLTTSNEAGALPLLGCWLLGGAIVQFTVAIFELLEGATTGGCVFLFFSAFFMASGSAEFFVKYFAAANKWAIPLNGGIDGWAWLALAILLFFFMFAYLKASSMLFLAVVVLEIGVICLAGTDLKLFDGHTYAAYCLLITGILACYIAGAIMINTAFGRSVLPLSGPLSK